MDFKSHKQLDKYIKQAARKLPIHECIITNALFETGKSNVIISRKRPNGEILFAGFLIDMYCLGLEEVFYALVSEEKYEFYKKKMGYALGELEYVSINHFHNIVYGALEYGEDLGFPPPKELAIAEYILEDVDDVEYEDIEFGHDGKPHYFSSSFQNDKKVLAILDKSVGKGNYHYSIKAPDFDFTDFDDEEDYFDEEEDDEYEDNDIMTQVEWDNWEDDTDFDMNEYIKSAVNPAFAEDEEKGEIAQRFTNLGKDLKSLAKSGGTFPLVYAYPEIAISETRSLFMFRDKKNKNALPSDEYALVENFCFDPDCDCRHVYLDIVSQRMDKCIATISYSWMNEEYYNRKFGDTVSAQDIEDFIGPSISKLNIDEKYIPELMKLFNHAMSDPNYRERIIRHYDLAKQKFKGEKFD